MSEEREMFFRGKKSFKKNDGGAILLQTLLGLGIMVAMTPIILNQIRKYNESINREEVISQMTLLQKAVTSYISFDRTAVPEGCVIVTGENMRSLLKDYGGERISSTNAFGQTYAFITCKKTVIAGDDSSDMIEAAVFAYGDVDDLTLNSIGEYLFDQGVVLSNDDHTELTNYNAKLSALLKTEIIKAIGIRGALVMFVSDAFMISDYLYINKGPGGTVTVNTMLANLNMNGNSLVDVYKSQGSVLNIMNSLKVAGLAGKKLEIANSTLTGVFSVENQQPFVNEKPMSVKTNNIELNSLNVENVDVAQIQFDPGDLDAKELVTQKLIVEGELNVVTSAPSEGGGGGIWNFGATDITADNLYSAGTVSNKFDKIVLKDTDNDVESYIYDGTVSLLGDFTDASSKLNLSGMSEVYDICWQTGNALTSYCVSDKVFSLWQQIKALWIKYFNKGGGY